jgi:hypothetical protein
MAKENSYVSRLLDIFTKEIANLMTEALSID